MTGLLKKLWKLIEKWRAGLRGRALPNRHKALGLIPGAGERK
jgi:hypothetical protein